MKVRRMLGVFVAWLCIVAGVSAAQKQEGTDSVNAVRNMKLVDRFLNYVKLDTQSDENSETVPSTAKQMVLLELLRDELIALGMQEVELDDKGYLFATLPSNIDYEVPVIGFISHVDTSPELTGTNVQPRVEENYAGGDIVLDAQEGILLSPTQFPNLLSYIGQDIVVTNGHTLLGSDDKSGIAAIMHAMAYLLSHPEVKHGKIRVAFNPDEEIATGAHHFDVERFGAQWAYTIDGGALGELEYENFNAAFAKIIVHGQNVHPGSAKDRMINSLYIASELVSMCPVEERPEHTEGYEGFYHLTSWEGQVEETIVSYLIRDHDRTLFEQRKKTLEGWVQTLNDKYGAGTITLELSDQYYNMREKIEPAMYIIDLASEAMKQVGVEPVVKAIRGGTDGVQLSYKGLLCPNIFAGGLNAHGRYEYVPVQSMEAATRVIVKITELATDMSQLNGQEGISSQNSLLSGKVSLYNSNGVKVVDVADESELDASNLPSGYYIVRSENNGSTGFIKK